MVIPSLGAPSLGDCLTALSGQTLQPDRIIVVLSGGALPPNAGAEVMMILDDHRLGFAAAANRGIQAVTADTGFIALLNDDAEPSPKWLETLVSILKSHQQLSAVQGTVIEADNPRLVDGRGLNLDHLGLPIQVERGAAADDGNRGIEDRLGVSATACLYRSKALEAVRFKNQSVFDEDFDCYHEDTDLALRLLRLGLRSAWVPGAPCLHLGSASGNRRTWRHPWWILSNRWRALAGNLSPLAFALNFPRLIRGEFRAIRTLTRRNKRTIPVAILVLAALPLIKIQGWLRSTPGPRLPHLPSGPQ